MIALVSEPTKPVREIADAMLDREAALLEQREKAGDRNEQHVTIAATIALVGCLALLLAALVNSGFERRRRRRGELELERNALHLQQALQEANRSSKTLRRLSTLAELLQNCRDLDEAINVIERAAPAAARRVGRAGADQCIAQHRRGAHALGRARFRPGRRDLRAG